MKKTCNNCKHSLTMKDKVYCDLTGKKTHPKDNFYCCFFKRDYSFLIVFALTIFMIIFFLLNK